MIMKLKQKKNNNYLRSVADFASKKSALSTAKNFCVVIV